jgi:predicted nucleotide-binding protein (sugar kinase/HSP70/actin superfamily)
MILNCDIIRHISNFLNLDDILNLSIVCKDLYIYTFDNIYYMNLAYTYYGKDFWIKASQRNTKASKPLKNFKLEIIRIENFQRDLDNINITRWTHKDFYDYWKYQ